ncbi:hypothetical protein D3C75_1358670 [compost metagenome]
MKTYLTPQETATDVNEWSKGQKRLRTSRNSDEQAYSRLLQLYHEARYTDEALPERSAEEAAALKEQLKL